jgi:rRNA maturation protein Nop10
MESVLLREFENEENVEECWRVLKNTEECEKCEECETFQNTVQAHGAFTINATPRRSKPTKYHLNHNKQRYDDQREKKYVLFVQMCSCAVVQLCSCGIYNYMMLM